MRVSVSGVAAGVVSVPVDTEPGDGGAGVEEGLGHEAQRLMVQEIIHVQTALMSRHTPRRHVTARHDAVILRQRADEGLLVLLIGGVVRSRECHTC